jgi:DNA-binding MarR family transcriptional regulator
MNIETNEDMKRPARVRCRSSYQLNRAAAIASRMVADGLAAVDARRYHYALLAALEEFGPASQASLGRRCGIDRSDIVAIVNELERKALIERAQDPTDRRRNTITITPAGLQHLRQLDVVMEKIQDDLLDMLDADERRTLVALLTRIVDHHSGLDDAWSPD